MATTTIIPRAAPMTVRSLALLVLISVLFYALITALSGDPASDDLRALWLAGQFFPTGDVGAVYAGSDGVFSMTPPEAWIEKLQSEGTTAAVYPFVYPPLWAWAASAIPAFGELARVMTILNPCLIVLSALLAMRIAQPTLPRPIFFAIGLAVASTSLVVLLPLSENQPHILVVFLTLLGVERARFGSPMAGGLAMALAASLKLYPAVFALFWLAAGNRRPVVFFILFGGALGALSIGVAGWPMHAAFLSEISAISNTVLMLRSNLSFESLIGYIYFDPAALSFSDTSSTGGTTNWTYTEKPASWRIWSIALQVSALSSLMFLAWRSKINDPLFWPLAFLVVAWLSPLSWMYYYIPAFLFLPALFDRLAPITALALAVLITAPTNYSMFISGVTSSMDAFHFVLLNGAAIFLAICTFLVLTLRSNPA